MVAYGNELRSFTVETVHIERVEKYEIEVQCFKFIDGGIYYEYRIFADKHQISFSYAEWKQPKDALEDAHTWLKNNRPEVKISA